LTGYTSIKVENKDLSAYKELENVYGVYPTRKKALNQLESIVKTYQLCPALIGLEKTNRQCFRYQLGLCKGACAGKESAESYNQRVETALERSKLETWPYKHAVEVQISDTKTMIVDQWIVKYLVDYSVDIVKTPLENLFDIDTYKILRSYLKTKPVMSPYVL